MRVIFRGAPLVLDDALLLGQGGEARVYAHPALALALKIFHDGARGPLAALRARKIAKLLAGHLLDGTLAISPTDAVHDDNGDVVGYAMPKLAGAHDIAHLAKKARTLSQNDVVALFRALAAGVDVLHARKIVAGDLNDGNVMLDAGGAAHIIDVDSMQIGDLPCPVAHERFLDPRLYGRNLVDDACFDAQSDAYALHVILFQSLASVHPYGGVHPKLPTLLRRAEASWSVLRGDVQLPRAALPLATLGDELLAHFARVFDDGARPALSSAAALDRVRFSRCKGCGAEHARRTCPLCSVAVAVAAIRTRGGVVEEVILERRGSVILAARSQRALPGAPAHDVAFLIDDGAHVRREDGAVVAPRGVRCAIAGERTVVDAATPKREWCAGPAGTFVIEGDALLHDDTRNRVGRVLAGGTRLVGGGAGGLGFYRAGRALMAFGFTPRSFYDVELPALAGGRVVDIECAFGDDGRALIGVAEDAPDGKRVHTLALVDARGHLVASANGAPDSAPHIEAVGGKCIAHGKILSVSNQGVLVVDVDGRDLRAGSIFSDTAPFVDASVELLAGSNGSLIVVSRESITRLRLRP